MPRAVIVVADALVVAALACVLACAIVVCRRRWTQGSACCGTHERPLRRLAPKVRDKSLYSHETRLRVAGMTCENCAIRVERALNGLPGTWATVSIADHEANVRTIAEPDLEAMRDAVAKAGYVLL